MLSFAKTKKAAKTTAKTLAKSAITLKTSIEFAVQPLMEDLKTKDHLGKIAQHFQELDKMLLEKTKQDSAELAKAFEKTEDELNKIIKKIRGFQEYVAQTEQSLEEKLLSKVNQIKEPKKDAKAQEDYKNQAQRLIIEITKVLGEAKKKVTELAEKAEIAMKHHVALKPKLAIYTLPESLNQSDKQAKKLKERLEEVCQASHGINLNTLTSLTSLGIEKDSISNFLPQLQNSVKSCAALIDQALVNLKPLFNPKEVTTTLIMSNPALVNAFAQGTNAAKQFETNTATAAKIVKASENQNGIQDTKSKDIKEAKNDSVFHVAINI